MSCRQAENDPLARIPNDWVSSSDYTLPAAEASALSAASTRALRGSSGPIGAEFRMPQACTSHLPATTTALRRPSSRSRICSAPLSSALTARPSHAYLASSTYVRGRDGCPRYTTCTSVPGVPGLAWHSTWISSKPVRPRNSLSRVMASRKIPKPLGEVPPSSSVATAPVHRGNASSERNTSLSSCPSAGLRRFYAAPMD